MDTTLILTSIGVFFAIIIVLVVILLIAKYYLSPSGNVKVTINGKETLEVEQGASLLTTLSENGVYRLPLVAVKVRADNANARLLKAVARFSTPKRDTSPAKKSRTTGVWAAKRK